LTLAPRANPDAFPVETTGLPPMVGAMNDLLDARRRALVGQIHTDKVF
jgi:hypothetical protein